MFQSSKPVQHNLQFMLISLEN